MKSMWGRKQMNAFTRLNWRVSSSISNCLRCDQEQIRIERFYQSQPSTKVGMKEDTTHGQSFKMRNRSQ